MESLRKMLEFVQRMPIAGKVISIVVVGLLAFLFVFYGCSVANTVTVGDGNNTSAGATFELQVDSTTISITPVM